MRTPRWEDLKKRTLLLVALGIRVGQPDDLC